MNNNRNTKFLIYFQNNQKTKFNDKILYYTINYIYNNNINNINKYINKYKLKNK